MAAPNNRRPGYSRRAQYGNFFGYIAAVAGLVVGVILLVVSTGNAGAFTGLRTAAADGTAPAARAAAGARTGSQNLWQVLAGYFTSGARVARLEREVAEGRVKLAEQAALIEENGRLKAMLALTQGDQRPVVVTRMIGSTSSSSRRFATIGAGANQGVRVGMGVRSPLGLIGRVIEVGSSSARLLLVTDADSSIPVRRASDGIQGYANGLGNGTVQIRLSTTGINPLHPGDAIVTSGSGGIYRPGEAVAVIVSLTPDGAIARPLSDPGQTEFVAVEPLFEELSAPMPQPRPAPSGKP